MNRLASLVTSRIGSVVVVVLWLAVLGLAGPLAGKLTNVEHNDAAAFLPARAPAARAAALVSTHFAAGRSEMVLVAAAHHPLGASDLAALRRLRAEVAAARLPALSRPGPLERSRDGEAVLIPITTAARAPLTTLQSDVSALDRLAAHPPAGVQIEVTGQAALLAAEASVFSNLNVKLLGATVAVVAILLILTYRSPFLWIVPLLVVVAAAGVAEAGAYGLGRSGLTLDGETVGIVTVLVFGAGTDYALLLVSRVREELARQESARAAVATALTRTAPTVLTSAGTVILALLCLLLAPRTDLAALGPVGAVGIAAAFLAMMTLLPAILSILGRRLLWPRIPRPGAVDTRTGRVWRRLAGEVTRRSRSLGIAGVLILCVLAVGVVLLRPGQVRHDGLLGRVPAVTGQRLVDAHFPGGASAPAFVVAPESARSRPEALARLIRETEGVASVARPQVSDHLVEVTAVLQGNPTSARAEAIVRRLRQRLKTFDPAALVGGPSATQVDLIALSARSEEIVIPLVALVVAIMLGLLLRSVVAPVLLTLSVIFSFLAALGVTAFVALHLFHLGGTDSSLPLLGFVFLVALGVDYSVFLMGRVREERLGAAGTTPEAVRRGLVATGGVVTSAGIVLAATFAVLAILPLAALTEIGFLVAFGVLLDTFLVRSIVVPSLGCELNDRLWWPARPAKTGTGEP